MNDTYGQGMVTNMFWGWSKWSRNGNIEHGITARLSNANDFPGKKKFFNEILEPNYISPVVSVC